MTDRKIKEKTRLTESLRIFLFCTEHLRKRVRNKLGREMTLTKKQKNVYDFICEFIEENGYSPTQTEIKDFFGFRSLGSVQDYIRYLTNAGYLKSDPGTVRGLEPISESQPSVEIPLLGDVAAGIPIEAIENAEMIQVPKFMIDNGEHFALNVHGSSMIEDGILNGDVIIVKKQLKAENGQTVVATIEGEATVKRFYRKRNGIELHPANSQMSPIFVEEGEFAIKGILVGLLRQY